MRPVDTQRDLVPRRDDLQVSDARLRAADAAVAPINGTNGIHQDLVRRDLQVGRQRVDRELRDPALFIRQACFGTLAGDERDVLARGAGNGEEHGDHAMADVSIEPP